MKLTISTVEKTLTEATSLMERKMEQVVLAKSYADAIKIVTTAKMGFVTTFRPLNDKMWRVIEYLEKQAVEELTCLRP